MPSSRRDCQRYRDNLQESSQFDFLRPTMASSSFSRDYSEPVEERNVARI